MSSAGILLHTRKRLWVRSGGECAHPECEAQLVEPTADGSEDTI